MYTAKCCQVSCIRQSLTGHELDKKLNNMNHLRSIFSIVDTKEKIIQFVIEHSRTDTHAASERRVEAQ